MAMADGYGLFWNSDSGDRKYDAQSFEKWLKKFFTSGVFEGDLQVLASSGMTVQVQTGYANVNGKVGLFESATNVTLSAANSRYPRIDTIIIERNDVDRVIQIDKVTGAYTGENPQPTAPIWDETQGIYQLVLAQIYVGAGVSSISQEDITDKRTDTDVCGYIAGTVNEMDFSQFAAQFESYYEQFVASNQADFEAWFDEMKGQLSTDAAGHLQAEVQELDERLGPLEHMEFPAATNGSSSDLLILRKSDGSGVKVITVANLRNIITGLLSDLDTTDKDSIVDAVNEVLAKVVETARWLDGLQELFDHFGIAGAGLANSICVDEEVSSTILADKATEITNGTFEGLWVGQYLKDGNQKYRFSDFDYRLHCGDTEITKHHILTVPDKCMYTARMNPNNVTTGAYVGTEMFTTNLAAAITTITNFIGSAHLLSHRNYLKDAVTNGYESGGSWYTRVADLMTEEMVYGGKEFRNQPTGVNFPVTYAIDTSQLAIFRLRKDLIISTSLSNGSKISWWLRDVVNDKFFTGVGSDGRCVFATASAAFGVRPAFPLIGNLPGLAPGKNDEP